MSKNEISRTISCIYFMKIWVDLGFESSEVSLVSIDEAAAAPMNEIGAASLNLMS